MDILNLGAPSPNVEDKRGFVGDAANVMFTKMKGRLDKITDFERGGKPLPGPMTPHMDKEDDSILGSLMKLFGDW